MTAQPVKGLGSNSIPACNEVKTLPIKEPVKAQKDEEGEGRDFSSSLALELLVNPLNIPTQHNYRLVWFLSLSFW